MTEKNWITYETNITPYKIISGIDIKKSPQENFVRIFTRFLKKFLLLLNKEQGIHLFYNSDFSEAHFIFEKWKSSRATAYSKTTNKELLNWIEIYNLDKSIDQKDLPQIFDLTEQKIIKILKGMFPESFPNGSNVKLTFLPFNLEDLNLGYFILWGTRKKNRSSDFSKTTVQGWLYSWYSCLRQYIQMTFKISKNIYLPEYLTPGKKQVAILFADIRNFTPLTDILLRRTGQMENSDILQNIVKTFYKEMSEVIHRNSSGRIDKFLGDGIMAIFGEQKGINEDPACDAVLVAGKMVERFDELKKEWKQAAFGNEFEKEFNATVEIDLGIGIDYGSVFFEMLGDDNHKEYSAIGDHVNFASRLKGVAAKDDDQNRKRPPIIISRTTHSCCEELLKKKEIIPLDVKGKPYKYECYGIYPEDLIDDSKTDSEEVSEHDEIPQPVAEDRDTIEDLN